MATRQAVVPVGNNQMKEVNNLRANLVDSLGTNANYWFLPTEPSKDMHPGCDGINWYIRALH